MSRKKKIIISVIATVLVLATAFSVVAAVIGRQHDIKRAQEEYEQAKNATNKHETTDASDRTSSEDLPPIITPDDTGGEVIRDEIILDVSDKDRNPNPEVIDATIEYGTKEVEQP
mgnify:CR=1 FL=1